MKSRLSSRQARHPQSAESGPGRLLRLAAAALAVACAAAGAARAAEAPAWLRAQLTAPLAAHDPKDLAVLSYASTVLTVLPNGHARRLVRRAYRILRPGGENLGVVRVPFDALSHIIALHGWSIAADGKSYEVRERDAVDASLYGVEDAYLMTDQLNRVMKIPGAQAGSLIGFEIEQELRPYEAADNWDIQATVPVRESHYTLQLPPGWGFRASWVNSSELQPVAGGKGEWQWSTGDIEPIHIETRMPPWRGIARHMVVSWFQDGAVSQGLASWSDLGTWYLGLARDRRASTPEIQRQVGVLSAGLPNLLGKLQALAAFMQRDIRYVGIELGIGGFQPHAASEVFAKRYGDCKDKATLLATMLGELGVESYYVVINTTRGAVSATTPPNNDFNHMILALRLPDELNDASLLATVQHPKLGRLLFFDPTDTLTPFGSLRGELQANYGLLVTPGGSELLSLPQLPPASNGLHRTAHLTLDADGMLHGTVDESRAGDAAMVQRLLLRATTRDADRIRPVEAVAAESLANFRIDGAESSNLQDITRPFEWHYSLEAKNYAKTGGTLLLLRPRVLGSEADAPFNSQEPRYNAIEFDGPERNSDDFEIALPAGYEVEELPQPASVDYSFASYRSSYSFSNHVLHYSRSREIRLLSVPVEKAEDLKAFYRLIFNDERRTAVFSKAGH
jgi:hypothetical protein